MVENSNLRADLFVMDLFQLGDLTGLHEKIEFLQNTPNHHTNLTIEDKFPLEGMIKSNTEIYQA